MTNEQNQANASQHKGDYVLTCCSAVDLTPEDLARRDIPYIPFSFELNGTPYKDDFGQDISTTELYRRMLAGEKAQTSQIPIGEYLDFWRPYLEQGLDVLHVTLSSGLSGTCTSACMAANAAREEFPGRRVVVVDSLAASSGYGMLVQRMADKRDEGLSIDELESWAKEHRLEVRHWFYSSDLTFFIQGGRISKPAGVLGGMLSICPVMDMARNGTLAVREKIRTKGKAQDRLVHHMAVEARDGKDYDGPVYIINSECLDDAHALEEKVRNRFPKVSDVRIYDIGATIGCHTGPGTVALIYWGTKRNR